MKINYKKYLIIGLVLIILALIVKYSGLRHYITFEQFKANREFFVNFVKNNYFTSVFIFFITIIFSVVSSLPVAGLLTLIAGFLFGVFWGTVYAVIGGTVGSMLAFLLFRYFFGKLIQDKYGIRFEQFNKNVEIYGAYYIVIAHLITAPYFVINTLAALTKISLRDFTIASLIGVIPTSLVYAFAGRQLGKINSLKEIFSRNVLIAFALLTLLSIISLLIKKYKSSPKI